MGFDLTNLSTFDVLAIDQVLNMRRENREAQKRQQEYEAEQEELARLDSQERFHKLGHFYLLMGNSIEEADAKLRRIRLDKKGNLDFTPDLTLTTCGPICFNPGCRHQLPPGSKFCDWCGTKYRPIGALYLKVCNCNQFSIEDLDHINPKFCQHCGVPQTTGNYWDAILCMRCWHFGSTDNCFCGVCGDKLNPVDIL